MITDARQPDAPFEVRLVAETASVRLFLARLLGARQEVDDLAQETVARALRYRSRFDPERDLKSWLLKIAFRVYLDHRSRSERRVRESDIDPNDVGQGDSSAERIDRLRVGLSHLSSVERQVILRFHARSESVEEVARHLGLKQGTVKSHLHRARRKLAESEEEK